MEEKVFRPNRWFRGLGPVLAAICAMLMVWLIYGMVNEEEWCGGWRTVFIVVVMIACFLILFMGVILSGFGGFDRVGVSESHLRMKTVFGQKIIPWNSVLWIKVLDETMFIVDGPKSTIMFNAREYENDDDLIREMNERTAPFRSDKLPSNSPDVLEKIVRIMMYEIPGVSASRIHDQIIYFDRKVKREDVDKAMSVVKGNDASNKMASADS